MARRRKLSPERKEFINGLLEHYQPSDAHDVQEMLKDLLGDTLLNRVWPPAGVTSGIPEFAFTLN